MTFPKFLSCQLQTPSAPWILSIAPPMGTSMLSPMDGCEHPLLYLPGTGKAYQETAISGSFQQKLVGMCNSVWVWWLIMDGMDSRVGQSLDGPSFCLSSKL